MKYGELNLGQVEAMVNKLGGMDGVNRLLADELVITRKDPPQPKNLLKFNQEVAVDAPKKALDLGKFFVTRRGLWIYDSFKIRASALLISAKPTGAAALKSYDLEQNAYDREIKANLPETHEVDLWVIAQMIQAQEGGKSGPLLNNGYANIFYVAGFVVRVRWDAGRGGWYVLGWSLGDDRWYAGGRVFSRN